MRKVTFCLLLLILLVSGLHASGQKIRGGFVFGFNVSQVDGDEIYGYRKYGFHGGAAGTVPLKKNFLLTLETLYAQKGANQPRNISSYRKYRLELEYVEVPFYLQYNDRDIFTVGAGFAFAKLVGVKEWEKGIRTSATLLGSGAVYDRNDYLALVDVKFRIWQRLSMNVRFQYSMDKIRVATFTDDFSQREWQRKQYNNLVTFRLAYMFNEPLPPKEG
ncbi:MAG TPA: outer membrane beta-barrel protein [Bacteroidales bacterium]|nr:outer membrane beta-barrel protein [Bacteroidales bacterium]HRZ49466.1 outer membrane beta-barrel protein [Bacteroidales bacterium]